MSEHVVLKVDVLEAGKKGECKDLSEFDNSQIVMARSVRASPKLQLLWGVLGL